MTRYSGDPDLYVHAREGNGNYRFVRRGSILNGNEETYAYLSDLESHENRLYFNVYADGSQATKFRIRIFRDCNGNGGVNCCSSDPLKQSWLKQIMDRLCSDNCQGEKIYCATYNGQPAIHVTPWTDCTDGLGVVYDCNGNVLGQYGGIAGSTLPGTLINGQLLWDSNTQNCNGSGCSVLSTEDFEKYSFGSLIALSSPEWDTWDRGQQGRRQDARVFSDHSWGENKVPAN